MLLTGTETDVDVTKLAIPLSTGQTMHFDSQVPEPAFFARFNLLHLVRACSENGVLPKKGDEHDRPWSHLSVVPAVLGVKIQQLTQLV